MAEVVARIGVEGCGLWLDGGGSWHFEDITRYDFAWPHTRLPSDSSSHPLRCDTPSGSLDKSGAYLETEMEHRQISASRIGEPRRTRGSGLSRQACKSLGYPSGMKDIGVEKSIFDDVLRRLINAKPQTFKETVAKPKPRKDGGVKQSARKSRGSAS